MASSPNVAPVPNLGGRKRRSCAASPFCCDQNSCLRCSVLAWAHELPTSKVRADSPFRLPSKHPRGSSLQRRKSLDEFMASPKKRASSRVVPPKTPTRPRRKPASEGNADEDLADEDLQDNETPIAIRLGPSTRGRAGENQSELSRTLASSGIGHVPNLQSSRPPTTESSAPSRASRGSSPSKKRNTSTLGFLDEYPITVKAYGTIRHEFTLPSDVLCVYKEIINIVNNGLSMIPKRWKSFFATDLEDLPDFIVENLLLPDGKSLPFDETFSEADLAMLGKVQQMAMKCEDQLHSEPEWNCRVHSPLFDLAFTRSGQVDFMNITTAKMSSAAKIRDGDKVIERLVDFGVTLENLVIPRSAVVDRLRQYNADLIGINQSGYTPLLAKPLALSIETKVSGDEDDAHAQLSIWTASQFKMLRKYRWDPGSRGPLPTLPVVSSRKGSFALHFAVPQENGMLFVKNAINLGNVTGRLDAWKIYLALRRLENWAVEVYAEWFRREILGIEPEGEA